MPRGFLWQVLYPVFVVSNEADPALGVPHGNALQFSGAFGKCYLYVVPEGRFRALDLRFDGIMPRNLHMCGYLRQSDA